MSFKNIAGKSSKENNETISNELIQAGITVITLPTIIKGEVETNLIGSINGWTFYRRWRYYHTQANQGCILLFKYADELHQSFGNDVRVAGHAGCPSPKEHHNQIYHVGVSSYHIDSIEGLTAFVNMTNKQKYDLYIGATNAVIQSGI